MSLACIDETTDNNVLQAMKDRTADLCTLTSGICGIGAAFTYTTIFRFLVFIQFLLPGLNFFLHLARPVVRLSSCLGGSFFSSRGSSFPASFKFFLSGLWNCLILSNIRRHLRSGAEPSSHSAYSADYLAWLRPYFLPYYPCMKSNIPQSRQGSLPAHHSYSRTQSESHFGLSQHVLASTVDSFSRCLRWPLCITSATRRYSKKCISSALRVAMTVSICLWSITC